MASTLTISFPNSTSSITFSLISADIKENFDQILRAECEAYYEGFQEHLIKILDENKDFFYASLTMATPIATKRIGGNSQTFSLVGWQIRFLEKKASQRSLNQRFFFSFVLYSPDRKSVV